MIRFLINTTIKKRDSDGNSYNFSIVTSTKTHHTLEIDSGWGSDGGNIKALLRKAGLEWDEFHYSERVVLAREFKRLKSIVPSFMHEHEITNGMILSLERPAGRTVTNEK